MPGQAARQRLAVEVRALFPGEPDDVLLPRQEIVEIMRLAGEEAFVVGVGDQQRRGAQWLIGTGRAPTSYVAGRGSRLGRAGRVFLDTVGDELRVGGHSAT
jgi:hypothetical protein